MGGVAVLHPQDCLNDRRDNLFSTPMKTRRTPKSSPNYSNPSSRTTNSNPSFTRSDGRKRSPPTGLRRNNHRAAGGMVADQPAVVAAKNLVMGQVKILKRGEALNQSSTVLKDVNNERKASNGTATALSRDLSSDQKVTKDLTVDRKAFSTKKKVEKEKKRMSNPNPKAEVLKADDFTLSSTDRLGPDPEMVPKQMAKNVADFFFAGSGFVDSPPPSSLPLPGFFTKNFVAAVKDDPTTDLRRILGLNLS